MESYRLIDVSSWPRREMFCHYRHAVPCRYGLTVGLDIGLLPETARARGVSPSAALLYLLSRAVNGREEFRMLLDEQGRPGVYHRVCPSFTVFHPDTETFSVLWTPWNPDFGVFYEDYRRVMETWGRDTAFQPQPSVPRNTFSVSVLPWIAFEDFHLDLPKADDCVVPIFTVGQWERQGESYRVPLSLQVHHAVCDGFHAARLLEDCRVLARDCAAWLPGPG